MIDILRQIPTLHELRLTDARHRRAMGDNTQATGPGRMTEAIRAIRLERICPVLMVVELTGCAVEDGEVEALVASRNTPSTTQLTSEVEEAGLISPVPIPLRRVLNERRCFVW